MSANRIIPYGYAVDSGKNVVHPGESQIIRRIYADYLGGISLLRIAQTLTAQAVEFLPGRSDWNKNRVKRILEDERYLGTEPYPAIIGAELQRQARALKESNNNQVNQSEVPFRLPCAVECALCGAKMARRHDPRRKVSKELWTCQNSDCKQIVNIDDAVLYDEITAILNRLIADPSPVRSGDAPPADPPIEVRRLSNEIDRALDSLDFDRDKVREDIFALAAEKYKNIDTRLIKSNMLRAEFEKSEPLSSFSPDLFKRTALKVRLGESSVHLILKNDQIIGREHDDADSEYTGGHTTA